MVTLSDATRLRVRSTATGKQSTVGVNRVKTEVQTNRGDYVTVSLTS